MIRARIVSINRDRVDVTMGGDVHQMGDVARRYILGPWSAELVITATDLSYEEIATLYRNETEFELQPRRER